MQRLLLRRTLRDLKSNFFRYLALFLLIVLCLFIVISVVGSAESVIYSVNEKAEQNNLESGQFGVFVPLTDSAINDIQAMGATLEECFYIDFEMQDSSTLRIMKNREKINLVDITKGRLAKTKGEILVERLYADAHDISVGDTITVGESKFTVTGIGTSADYDACLQNMSDMSCDGNVFGTAFVTSDAYDTLLSSGSALHAQELRYSYKLSGDATDREIKEYLQDFKISLDEVDDEYFQEFVNEEKKDRDEVTDGIQELVDGSTKITDALNSLDDGSAELKDGIEKVYDGLSQLNSQTGSLSRGSAQVLAALRTLESGSKQLSFSTDSIHQLRDASKALLNGMNSLDSGLQDLASQVGYENFEIIMNMALTQQGVDPSQLSPDAQILLAAIQSYLDSIKSGLEQAAQGSSELAASLNSFDQSIASLPDSLEKLQSGISKFEEAISALTSEYKTLDNGVSSYSDGMSQVCDGYKQIVDGSKALASGARELAENGDEFSSGVKELQEETDKILDDYFPLEVQNLTDFVAAEDNPRIKAANNDVEMNIGVGILAGIILLILITYVISIFVIHSIDRESSIIGALYALGLKKRQLLIHYTMLPVVLCFVGGVIGTLLGYSDTGISIMSSDAYVYFSIPEIQPHYSSYLLVYGLIMPAVIAFVVNIIIIRKRLNRTALSLLKNDQTIRNKSNVQLKRFGFIRAFQIRQFLREKRSCYAVLAGMFVSMLILILGLNCYVLCTNLKVQNTADTTYSYMYLYKYPTETPPEGGEIAYVEGLNKTVLGYDMEISIIGIENDNSFFPKITSTQKGEISVSSSVASKYGLSVGDELILHDNVNDAIYGFTVKEIVPYSVGLSCFMDIDSMRELFNQEDDYYNVVYSDHELDIDNGRLYSITTKENIDKSSDIFIELMMPMIIMMTVVSILIFLIVMYQMIKVMIDRSANSISMMKIFGYRNKEISKLYLDGNLIIVAVGALVLLPITKLLMDAIYPNFVANVACGIDLTWSFLLYAIVYVGIILCYLLIRTLLLRRLKRMTPANILKNRE